MGCLLAHLKSSSLLLRRGSADGPPDLLAVRPCLMYHAATVPAARGCLI